MTAYIDTYIYTVRIDYCVECVCVTVSVLEKTGQAQFIRCAR